MTRVFYYATLMDRGTSDQLASEMIFYDELTHSLEEVAIGFAGFFENEPHHEDSHGKDIHIFGPFKMDHAPQIYAMTGGDFDEGYTATLFDPDAVAKAAGKAIEEAYPFGYRSEDNEA